MTIKRYSIDKMWHMGRNPEMYEDLNGEYCKFIEADCLNAEVFSLREELCDVKEENEKLQLMIRFLKGDFSCC